MQEWGEIISTDNLVCFSPEQFKNQTAQQKEGAFAPCSVT